MFTGEGYSSSQLAFFNAPSSSTFEPDVEKYWESYIASGQNPTVSSTMSNMAIWMNIFPLQFSTPIDVFGSTFAANVTAPNLSASEKNSQSLTRDVTSRFGLNEMQAYTAGKGSLSTSSGSEIPGRMHRARLSPRALFPSSASEEQCCSAHSGRSTQLFFPALCRAEALLPAEYLSGVWKGSSSGISVGLQKRPLQNRCPAAGPCGFPVS